jgi:NAD(P)-dependent dehydrogenase (short-subunit alcohol dehydrogenase family)
LKTKYSWQISPSANPFDGLWCLNLHNLHEGKTMITDFQNALIIGAGRGTGRAIAQKLANAGTKVTAVARTSNDLETLAAEQPNVTPHVGDGAGGIAKALLSQLNPDLLVLAGGITPQMSSYHEQDWETFSATWNSDTKMTFEFLQAALEMPLAPNSTIVSLSSGAAISGSPLSGGYAGAKRMQHYLTNYTAWESDKRGLGLRCFTVYPKQFIAGTQTADTASNAYAMARGISQGEFMAQWATPLTTDLLAARVIDLADPKTSHAPGAWGVTGSTMEPLT